MEAMPVWSPDGKMIAFAGQRFTGEPAANICIVWLAEDDEKTAHDRKLDKALEKMKGRKKPGADKSDSKEAKTAAPVVIDFDRLHERVKRISISLGSATPRTLFWSPDCKKLAFTAAAFEGMPDAGDSKPGTYTIDVADTTLTPKLLTPTVGKEPVWLKQGNQIVWLVGGVPDQYPGRRRRRLRRRRRRRLPKGKGKGIGPKGAGTAAGNAVSGGTYAFAVRQTIDVPARNAAVFDTCWRIMRDHWYDGNLGNRDWNAVRAKYRPIARTVPDLDGVATLVQLMLGELNGSHLGFTLTPSDAKKPVEVRDVTAHLGVRFERSFAGPGLKIRDVLTAGPADKPHSRLHGGEIILKIDGQAVDGKTDLTVALNGPIDREVLLSVQDAAGKTRDVRLRPITYPAVQPLLYDQWLRHNRKLVAAASRGKLGYLHISQMSMPTFRKFEEELVSQGAGKDGLIIDVRENPGGYTADHLLTALTQPLHAITVPRGGGPGYPMDRKVYVSWHKPIVVLCNQNSGSNAEIFSHAIKTLKRGQLVGVQTAGAVISTGRGAGDGGRATALAIPRLVHAGRRRGHGAARRPTASRPLARTRRPDARRRRAVAEGDRRARGGRAGMASPAATEAPPRDGAAVRRWLFTFSGGWETAAKRKREKKQKSLHFSLAIAPAAR